MPTADEPGPKPRLDSPPGLGTGDEVRAEAEHIRVIVLARQPSEPHVPTERGPAFRKTAGGD